MDKTTMCQQLAEHMGAGQSKIIPQILESLVDEREAKFLLAASPPASIDELAEKTGIPASEVEEMIDPMFKKGLIFKSKKPEGTRYYRFRHALQFHDATAVAMDPVPEMMSLWKRFMEEEWDGFSRKFEEIIAGPVLRVIPVNVGLEADAQVLAHEDVTSMIDAARNVAVTKCSCRAIDGACGHEIDNCLQLDRAADYAIDRGTGRKLERDEALSILERCKEEGLVHVTENRQSLGLVICNCCSDCCINWASTRTGLGKFAAPSRFLAVVDEDECNGCELCVERCFFEALAMKDGNGLVAINAEKCMGCGMCQVVCAPEAIGMSEVRPQEFIPA